MKKRDLHDLDTRIGSLPFDGDLKRRLRMTVLCPDCDDLPKVEGAEDISRAWKIVERVKKIKKLI